MGNRHNKIGIKQGLRLEWLDKALSLKLAGLKNADARRELTEYMSDKLDNGTIGIRGASTTQIAVSMLSKIWINPEKELLKLHSEALEIAKISNNLIPIHWAMLCSAYPFWYNVAVKTGRLFNLQEQTSKKQIIQRIREEYGDRSSVIRSAQRVIQGFLGIGILKESNNKNYYEPVNKISCDAKITILLYKSVLYAIPEGKATLELLNNNPAFFPFRLTILTSDFISQQSREIDIIHYGLDDVLLKLRDS